MKWGYDPAARSISTDPKEEVTVGQNIKKETEKTESEGVADPASELVARNKSLSLVSAIRKLLENSRAMVCLFIIFVYGFVFRKFPGDVSHNLLAYFLRARSQCYLFTSTPSGIWIQVELESPCWRLSFPHFFVSDHRSCSKSFLIYSH